MNNWEFRAITTNDIPSMANLLLSRQNLELKELPLERINLVNFS